MFTANAAIIGRPMSEKDRIIARQEELIHRLSWNRGFGCYNKSGFAEMKWPEIAHRAKWLIYLDVDGVHEINEAAGTYEVFNTKMRAVWMKLRSTDVISGQYNSGDEFLACILAPIRIPGDRRQDIDPEVVKDRLVQALAEQGLTALFAIVPVRSMDLEENIQPAADQILAQKKARGRTR